MKDLNRLINKPRYNKHRKRWEIRFSDGTDPTTGRRHRKVVTGKTKEAVRDNALEFVKQRLLNEPQSDSRSTEVYLRQWHQIHSPTWSKRTVELYLGQMENHIIPAIGHVPLGDLRPHHIQRMMSDIAAKGLHATANKCRRLLNSALKAAVESDLIPKNPVVPVKPVKEQPRPIHVPPAADIRKFLNSARDDRLYAAYLVLVTTGLRRGELLGLKWENLTETGVFVQQSLSLVDDTPVLSELKTKSSRRFVSMDREVITTLEQHRQRQRKEKADCGGSWTETGLIFTTKIGTCIHPRNFRRSLDNAMRKAGVTKTSIHAFRHAHASLLIGSGIDVKSVSTRLGHSKTSTTVDIYTHAIQQHQQRAALPLAQLLGEEPIERPGDDG